MRIVEEEWRRLEGKWRRKPITGHTTTRDRGLPGILPSLVCQAGCIMCPGCDSDTAHMALCAVLTWVTFSVLQFWLAVATSLVTRERPRGLSVRLPCTCSESILSSKSARSILPLPLGTRTRTHRKIRDQLQLCTRNLLPQHVSRTTS